MSLCGVCSGRDHGRQLGRGGHRYRVNQSVLGRMRVWEDLPARVVNDFFYDSTNVAISFGEIKRTESSRVLVQVGM